MITCEECKKTVEKPEPYLAETAPGKRSALCRTCYLLFLREYIIDYQELAANFKD